MLKLDGYRKTDPDLAYSAGVEKTYRVPAPYGPKGRGAIIRAVIKYSGAGNVEYRDAVSEIVATMEDGVERGRAVTAALYDHCIVEWSTTIQSGGKSLEGTRENFLALSQMDVEEIVEPILRLSRDIQNRQVFVEKQVGETVKN